MYFKSLIAAAITSAAIAFSAGAADAKTNITIGIGIPAPIYEDPGYGYEYPPPPPPRFYDDERAPVYYDRPPVRRQQVVSCGQAARSLRRSGYRRIEAQDCSGRRYSFIGWRHGEPFIISVSARSGRIVGRSPL